MEPINIAELVLTHGGVGGGAFLATWYWLNNSKKNGNGNGKHDIHDILEISKSTEHHLNKLSETTSRMASNIDRGFERNTQDHDRVLAAVNRIEGKVS